MVLEGSEPESPSQPEPEPSQDNVPSEKPSETPITYSLPKDFLILLITLLLSFIFVPKKFIFLCSLGFFLFAPFLKRVFNRILNHHISYYVLPRPIASYSLSSILALFIVLSLFHVIGPAPPVYVVCLSCFLIHHSLPITFLELFLSFEGTRYSQRICSGDRRGTYNYFAC